MLRLTSLAPDIVEAILRGDEPEGLPRRSPGVAQQSRTKTGLSLEKLQKNLPVRWDEQRPTWR